ncbi:MAG TPA: polysaccharide ABC transporter ATP-binding protein [Blastocatellia bacterium]
MKPIIRVDNISKQYRVGLRQVQYETLRDSIVSAALAPMRMLSRRRTNGSQNGGDKIWALKDVSFEVGPGEVVGVIGRNGAGKSTLLKILSRITEPTRGNVDLYGRLGSLLEVGTGFHAELTGRENVYLSGAILGMKKADIKRKFDEIVDFAEVERFLDNPVKYYSSGMYMRLAFAVAVYLEPEILLVDEVLAVGDADFQKKCLKKMGDLSKQGRTILLVSHNLAAVQSLCPRSLYLSGGSIKADCDSTSAIRHYLGSGQATGQFDARGRTVVPKRVKVLDAWMERNGAPASVYLFGDKAELFVLVEAFEKTTFCVELILRQADGIPIAFAPSGLAKDWEAEAGAGTITIKAELPPIELAAGFYSLDIILGETGVRFLDCIESAISFNVDSTAIGRRNWHFTQSRGQGYSLWDVTYRTEAELGAGNHVEASDPQGVQRCRRSAS